MPLRARRRQFCETNAKNLRLRGNLRQFIRERLKLSPLTHNGKIRRDCRTLADEVAWRLMHDARKGKLEAIRLLIDASEGDLIRQRVLNHLIHRIYLIIEKHVTDEETLFQIGRDLYLLKHRCGKGSNAKYPNPTFTDASDLQPEVHEDPKVVHSMTTVPLLGIPRTSLKDKR